MLVTHYILGLSLRSTGLERAAREPKDRAGSVCGAGQGAGEGGPPVIPGCGVDGIKLER